MKLSSALLMLLVLLLALNSCKETEEPTQPIGQNPGPDSPRPDEGGEDTDLPTVDVNILIPEGLDLSGGIVSTGLMDFSIDPTGNSKVVLPPGVSRIAYVFDKEENLVMMGLISANHKTIDFMSTSEALAYLGLGMWYFPEQVQQEFFQSMDKVGEIAEFKTQIKGLAGSDPYFLEKGLFQDALEGLTQALEKDADLIDIRSRQINVDRTGKASGIRVYENDPQTVKIQNYYRRLAKAFIYKHAFINKEDEENTLQIVKENIRGNDVADQDVSVTGTAAFGGTMGTIADWVSGKGMDYAMVETEPIPIKLGPGEKETRYKVRLIGPSFRGTANYTLTATEKDAFRDLMLRQFAFDFVLPIMGEVFGELTSEFDADYFRDEVIIEAVKYLYAKYPNLWDMLVNGNWKSAGTETMKYLVVDLGGGYFQEQIVKKVVDRYANQPTQNWIELDRDYLNEKKVSKYLKVLKVIDLTLKAVDMAKLAGEIGVSNTLEEFVVKAIEHDIKLSPNETSVLTFKDTPFTVSSQSGFSDGQALLFKWRTSGQYGFLKDALGNEGITFENGQKTVNYRSNKSAAQLPDDAVDTIYVEAYLKQGERLDKVGSTEAVVTVKPAELVVKPDGLSLVGRKKDQVRLHVEWANGDTFHQPEVFDYKYEWSTTGKHGLFDGFLSEANTQTPQITYQALDEEIEEGIDQITVRVSLSPKGKNDYSYYATAEGDIKVVNDEHYEILHLPLTVEIIENPCSTYCFTNWLNATFKKEDNHESYTVRFYGFKKQAMPSVEGKTYTWNADQEVPRAIDFSRHKTNLDDKIGVWILNNAGGTGANPRLYDALQAFGGMVEVKIKLKPE